MDRCIRPILFLSFVSFVVFFRIHFHLFLYFLFVFLFFYILRRKDRTSFIQRCQWAGAGATAGNSGAKQTAQRQRRSPGRAMEMAMGR